MVDAGGIHCLQDILNAVRLLEKIDIVQMGIGNDMARRLGKSSATRPRGGCRRFSSRFAVAERCS